MDDLKAISSFKPSSEVSTCVVLEKKKTYLYDRWGTTYEDSAWTNEKLEEVVYSSKYYFEEEKRSYFYSILRNLPVCKKCAKDGIRVRFLL